MVPERCDSAIARGVALPRRTRGARSGIPVAAPEGVRACSLCIDSSPYMAPEISHFVFVDFENVPSVDLALLEGKPVHVTLFIGEKQTRLDFALVRQIHRYASQVRLIPVGASGRNALDLVLAAHLGRAMGEREAAEFTIISRDHDFDPVVAHFSASGVSVRRAPDLAALPIFRPAKPRAPLGGRRATESKQPASAVSPPAPLATPSRRQAKLERLAEQMKTKSHRPKTRVSLLHHIDTVFGPQLAPADQEAILAELLGRKLFTIPDGKKVVYAD